MAEVPLSVRQVADRLGEAVDNLRIAREHPLNKARYADVVRAHKGLLVELGEVAAEEGQKPSSVTQDGKILIVNGKWVFNINPQK